MPKELVRRKKTVIAIGDAHCPWASPRTLSAVYKLIAKVQPDIVIQMGDLMDAFSFSRFPRTMNGYSPQQELKLARRDGERLWNSVQDAAPKAKCIQLFGNHECRVVKKALADAPELEHFVEQGMKSIMQFENVELVDDSREVFMIEGVGYLHGYLLQPGAHSKSFGINTVTAHTHRGGVFPHKLERELIWELNVGFVANRHAGPLGYGPQRRFSNWTLGVGLITPEAPIFIPLNTEDGR